MTRAHDIDASKESVGNDEEAFSAVRIQSHLCLHLSIRYATLFTGSCQAN